MPFEKKYASEEERLEARRRSKREWARRNPDKIKKNFDSWKEKKKKAKELRNLFTREELIANVQQIKKDFECMTQEAVAAKWGRSRKTLLRMVQENDRVLPEQTNG